MLDAAEDQISDLEDMINNPQTHTGRAAKRKKNLKITRA